MLHQSLKLITTFALLWSFAFTSMASEKERQQIEQHFQKRMEELLNTDEVRYAKQLLEEYESIISILYTKNKMYSESENLTHVRFSVGFPNFKAVPADKIYAKYREAQLYKSDIDDALSTLNDRQYTIVTAHDPDLARISIEIYLVLDKNEEQSIETLKKFLPKKKRKNRSAFDHYNSL